MQAPPDVECEQQAGSRSKNGIHGVRRGKTGSIGVGESHATFGPRHTSAGNCRTRCDAITVFFSSVP